MHFRIQRKQRVVICSVMCQLNNVMVLKKNYMKFIFLEQGEVSGNPDMKNVL